MTLAEALGSLFPAGHSVTAEGGLIHGHAAAPDGRLIHVIGVAAGTPLGVEGALTLTGQVLEIVAGGRDSPILVLIDSSSQRMSRRDELLGLSEFLAHLAKALLLAEASGHQTIGLLYGGSAAGAFIATALSTGTLIALPDATPAVMDLPSMARVTKLPLEVLETKAHGTPVFAPGVDNLVKMGAIERVWDPARPLAAQLAEVLAEPRRADARDTLGAERHGRTKAAAIAQRVCAEFGAH
jgi:malonate decarboxylase gamma subunit